jgi:hypothetical protein
MVHGVKHWRHYFSALNGVDKSLEGRRDSGDQSIVPLLFLEQHDREAMKQTSRVDLHYFLVTTFFLYDIGQLVYKFSSHFKYNFVVFICE